ncbi:cell division protein FtsL [Aquibacillus albus]|nr:cell division protein FtsL [Aquibacillus albus]
MAASEAKSWQQTWQDTQGIPTRQTEHQPQVNVKRYWITPGEKFIYSLFSIVTIFALVFTVSFSSSTDSLNREVQQLEQNVQKQQTENQNLQYKVKEYSNPDRIIQIAKKNGLKIQNTKVKQASQLAN